jgi:hypothetical protein
MIAAAIQPTSCPDALESETNRSFELTISNQDFNSLTPSPHRNLVLTRNLQAFRVMLRARA